MEEYEKKHDHAVAEKETDIPKLHIPQKQSTRSA